MNILDSLLNAVTNEDANGNTTSGSIDNSVVTSIIGLINDPQSGGLMGLVEKISAGGLNEQVKSWVSTGQNLPVTGNQIQAALGSSVIQDIASKVGIDSNDITNTLARLLPLVIDKLTPNGQVSSDNTLQTVLTGLSSLLGNK
ncbi:MAG: YidB family protein [Methylococcaceae bacterium]|nr:YidB family protein [Methylococcaceae bacterium]